MMKCTIYYRTNNKEEIHRIQKEYSLPEGYNINGEITCDLSDEVLQKIAKEIKLGFIQIRNKM